MSDTNSSDTDHHEISARATAHHYSQYDDPDQIPDDGKASGLIEFDQLHIAHVGYECTCGKRFNFGRTASEHLRSVDTETEK